MTYSRRRLVGIACFWLFAFTLAGAIYGIPADITPGANAQESCTSEPCMFPAEKHVGGIVMGVSYLSGEGATTFEVDGDGVDTALPSGRVDNTDETIGLGLNNLNAEDFFLYKGWKYDDPDENNADVHMWIEADSADLETEGGNDGCGNQETDGFTETENCDLLVYSGEISTGYFDAEATVLGAPVSATTEGLWVEDPEDDECSPISFDPTDLGINICLQLIQDGTLASGDIGSTDIQLYNFMTRIHYAKAVRDNNKNKRFTLNDGYLEIRHGKGNDRSRVLTGDTSEFGGDQWQEPVTGAGGSDETYEHGVSQGFICEGSPDGSNCNPANDRLGGDENDGAYDDIHR